MIVADTGAVVALLDRSDRHHRDIRAIYDEDPAAWVLPWSILPEVDYLIGAHLGEEAEKLFLEDLAERRFEVEWGRDEDLARAAALAAQYRDLRLGLVDATVIAVAERVRARAIATLDLRDFGAVAIQGSPALWPRDRRPPRRRK
jgi:predicted nucleic acid-binding protein